MTTNTNSTISGRIYEQGNGLPDAGDYVISDGQLYRVVEVGSRVQKDDLVVGDDGQTWAVARNQGDYVFATVEEADWSDCEEGAEHSAKFVRDED